MVAEDTVRERQPPLGVEPRGALVDEPLAEHHVPEQPALLREPDLRAVGELARLAEVVDDGRGDDQV